MWQEGRESRLEQDCGEKWKERGKGVWHEGGGRVKERGMREGEGNWSRTVGRGEG